MKKYLVEFIGTFFLVLTVGMAVIDPGAGPMGPLAMGAVLMAMVYAGKRISGAHYNPAVTIAAWLRGTCPISEVPPYIGAQLAAGVVAALAVMALKGDPAIRADEMKIAPALIGEFFGAFAVCYVTLNVTGEKAAHPHDGLAIGFAYAAMGYTFNALFAFAFNPAVAIGLAVMHKAAVMTSWVYGVSDFGAAVFAVTAYKFLHAGDSGKSENAGDQPVTPFSGK